MSRIGKKPIQLPNGVTVKVGPDALDIQGPKGKLIQRIPPGISFEVVDGQLKAATMRQDAELGKFHGLARSSWANGVLGVTEGLSASWTSSASGYSAEVRGQAGGCSPWGYSHPVVFDVPAVLDIAIDQTDHPHRSPASIGSWWEQVAAKHQASPEARVRIKQKGVRYTGEVLRRRRADWCVAVFGIRD
jgi:large subunit ribosomal protein L6